METNGRVERDMDAARREFLSIIVGRYGVDLVSTRSGVGICRLKQVTNGSLLIDNDTAEKIIREFASDLFDLWADRIRHEENNKKLINALRGEGCVTNVASEEG
jgi:hypothetical protein